MAIFTIQSIKTFLIKYHFFYQNYVEPYKYAISIFFFSCYVKQIQYNVSAKSFLIVQLKKYQTPPDQISESMHNITLPKYQRSNILTQFDFLCPVFHMP